MSGLREIIAAHAGRESLPRLANRLSFEVHDLLPLADAAQLLGFATVKGAVIELTADGRESNDADIDISKNLFARRARQRVPLVRATVNAFRPALTGRSVRASSSICRAGGYP